MDQVAALSTPGVVYNTTSRGLYTNVQYVPSDTVVRGMVGGYYYLAAFDLDSMVNAVQTFPRLSGIGWDFVRSSEWNTNVSYAVSGASSRFGYWAFPRYTFELTYDFVRGGGPLTSEYAALLSTFNSCRGSRDALLLFWADDCEVVNQLIGTGNGVTSSFQLQRTFGTFTEPVFAPVVTSGVRVGGVLVTATVSPWESTTPGVLHLPTAPPVGSLVTVDILRYYWPVKFKDDTLSITGIADALYTSSVKLEGVRKK